MTLRPDVALPALGAAAIMIVACAAAPAAPAREKPVQHVDAAASEEASVAEASAPASINCDPPRVRDSVTLVCTDHAPCPAGQDLVSGACTASCPPMYPTRKEDGGCTCAPGLIDVRGAELGGCAKPGELDFSTMCKSPHQHFDGSIVPTCECDAGFVHHSSGGLGFMNQCIRTCPSPLSYDPVTDRCRACASNQDAMRGVCIAKCPTGSKRDASGECMCSGGMFLDHGQCVHCTPDRVWDGATSMCNCPAGTEDWSYEGCLAACPAGEHRFHDRCVPDCTSTESNDQKTGECGTCDASMNAFVFDVHGHTVCVRCAFDEVLDHTGACVCRPGFRRANNHCVSP